MGMQEFLDSNMSKGINFPLRVESRKSALNTQRIITCHRRGKTAAQTIALELEYFIPALIKSPWRNHSMQSVLV